MAMHDVGDNVTVNTTLKDVNGVLTDATVAFSVTKPDGTVITPVVQHLSTGKYSSSFTVDQPNTWVYKWTASGAVIGVDTGQITVVNAGRVLVAALDEFRDQLDRADFDDDEELRMYLEAATNQIEWLVGPLTPTSYTERIWGCDRLALRHFPVTSVQSVSLVVLAKTLQALTTDDFYVDTQLNEVRLPFWYLRNEYEIAYTAGRTSIPADIKLAGLIIAQHLWLVQNARFTLNAPAEDQLAMTPGSGFSIPYRALELLRPYLSESTIPGIA